MSATARLMLLGAWLATAVVFAAVARAHPDAPNDAAPPGAPYFTVIETVEGTPPDSAGGREFWSALRGAFTGSSFTTERPAARRGGFVAGVPISNRFALLEGSSAASNPDVYRVQLTLEWLQPSVAPRSRPGTKRPAAAPADTTARAFTSVLVWPPGVDPAVVRIAPASDTVTFHGARSPRGAFAKAMGRSAALLVLEHLHHLSGDLPEDERLRLERAERLRPAASTPMRR